MVEVGSLPPFAVEPKFVERIWGTADLRPWYEHVTNPASEKMPIGEVWLTGDDCGVASGPLTGKTLGFAFAEHAEAMLGPSAAARMQGQSPLLLKVIFAREKLSVQVHPDDRLAQKYGQPRGKTECWFALAAEPGAEVAAGLNPGVTLDDVERGVREGTLEESLTLLPVAAGDMIYVDAGTVHAIWPGSVLLETQQNCDLTYRLYDYGRPRELHVVKALEATRLQTAAGKVKPVELADRTVLVDRDYFCVERIRIEGGKDSADLTLPEEFLGGEKSSLSYLFAASGAGEITVQGGKGSAPISLPKCGMVAVPASAPPWRIRAVEGMDLIRVTPRWPKA